MDNLPFDQGYILFQPVKNILVAKKESIQALERLGIITLRDLLFHKPNSYQVKILEPNFSKLQDGQLIQAEVTIQDISLPANRRMPIKIMVNNHTGSILLVFFNKIPPFIFNKLKIGSRHIISGKVQFFDYYFQISHPEFILKKNLESPIEPIYPLTFHLVNKQLYSYVIEGIEIFMTSLKSYKYEVDKDYINKLLEDLKILHLYKVTLSPDQIEQAWSNCIKRLAERELFANQASIMKICKHKYAKNGRRFWTFEEMKRFILTNLGFELTAEQEKVIAEIEHDQRESTQMIRLLQGDVGSGKTLVALLTMVNVALSGAQSTLMAPTDLLANQHYNFFVKALEGTGISLMILTGKTLTKDRKIIMQELENGNIQLLIGTHALFQEKINFKDLGYIIIDEQHKFGVEQRLSLINKATHPDVLVMTATPIPRSLTLTIFGDMVISKLTGKPGNRLPIVTKALSIDKIELVIEAINKKIMAQEKIYWVCPLIDQNNKDQMQEELNPDLMITDVYSRYASLEAIYPGKVGMMHGKMSADQKDIEMQKFKSGESQILVSTTVIEVGIDVPEATLIIIENAEQFGLAQIHQLRGRVGRGSLQSYCIMLYNFRKLSQVARKRIEIMKNSTDGFYIAEQDLILRGSGEIIGTRQSGEPQFFFADLARDLDILVQANKLAKDTPDSQLVDFQIKLFVRNSEQAIKSG